MSKFKTNLLNFKLPEDSPKYTIGYLYRDYTNPKVYSLINEKNFWLDTYKNSASPSIIEKELDSKDKFLLSCLKNFKQTRSSGWIEDRRLKSQLFIFFNFAAFTKFSSLPFHFGKKLRRHRGG